MIQINDEEILLFTDIHIGVKSNSVSRLDVADEYVDKMIEHIKERNIKTFESPPFLIPLVFETVSDNAAST